MDRAPVHMPVEQNYVVEVWLLCEYLRWSIYRNEKSSTFICAMEIALQLLLKFRIITNPISFLISKLCLFYEFFHKDFTNNVAIINTLLWRCTRAGWYYSLLDYHSEFHLYYCHNSLITHMWPKNCWKVHTMLRIHY